MRPIPDCSAAQHYHRTKVSELRVLCQASIAEYNELRHECLAHRQMLVTLAQANRAADQATIAEILARFASEHLPSEPIDNAGYFINVLDLRPGAGDAHDKGAAFETEAEARNDFEVRKALHSAVEGEGDFEFCLWIDGDLVDSFWTTEVGYVAALGEAPPAIAAKGEKSCQ